MATALHDLPLTTASTAHLGAAARLGAARSLSEVLGVLVECGAPLGVPLWALAVRDDRGPAVWLAAATPLEPLRLREMTADFLITAGSQLGGGPAAWASVRPQAFCLDTALPTSDAPMGDQWETLLRLGERTRVLLRAVAVAEGARAAAPDWAEVAALVRASTPYLRALTLGFTPQASLLDPESGAYSEACFLDTLDREIERARRHLGELSLAVVELRPLDLTQELGVEVHAAVGGHLREAVRRTDLIGRLGRRSYGAFLYGTGPRPALIAAGRIADALAADPLLAERTAFAIGVSGWEVTGPDAQGVLGQAREAAMEALLIAPGRAFVYV